MSYLLCKLRHRDEEKFHNHGRKTANYKCQCLRENECKSPHLQHLNDDSLYIYCKDMETAYSECYNAQCFPWTNTQT